MGKLKFRNDPDALERLTNATNALNDYADSHPDPMSDSERREFRKLLKERAAALSEATGMNIRSIVDDD